MKGGIFAWIRAVAEADLSPGLSKFCLQLIPLIDSKSLMSPRSIASTASKVSAAVSSLKTYRRTLKHHGLIANHPGWYLTLPCIVTGTCTGDQLYPQRYTSCICGGTPLVSPQIPPLYNGTSTSPSTSPSTNDQCWEKEEVKTRELSSLHTAHRPDVHGRSPTHPVRHQAWLDTWRASKGKDWPWPGWTEAVLPYLTEPEREELLGAALSTDSCNLAYLTAITTRICSGKPRAARPSSSSSHTRRQSPAPVVLDHTTDSLWKGVFT